MLDRLRHVVVETEQSADGALTQRRCAAGLFRVDNRRDRCERCIRFHVPHGTSAARRYLVGIECLAHGGDVLKLARRGARRAADIRNVLVKCKTIAVDLLGERDSRRLDKLAVEVVDVHRTLQRGDLHVHRRNLVELDRYGLAVVDVLHLNTLRCVKLLCFQLCGLADLNFVAALLERVGIVLVYKVREHEVFDQTRQRLACDLFDG